MSTKTEDIRYPRAAIAETITQALGDRYDFTVTTGWVKPPGCPACRQDGEQCDLAAGLIVRIPDGCRGYVSADARLPADESFTAAELVDALPEPDSAGLVSAVESGNILGRMVSVRLRNQAYRRQQAFTLLGDAFDALEQSLDPDKRTQPAEVPEHALRCQWCTGPIPAERGPKARYCSNSHRVTAHRARKRAQERQANAVCVQDR